MKLQKLFLSFFGIGFLPKAPGTWGSLATLPLLYLFSRLPLLYSYGIFFLLLVLSLAITHHVQKKLKTFDPSWIVIDEVLGMITAWFFYPEWNPLWIFLLFALFRFFDIVKVWPANWVDKNLKNGAGTILDDIISGLYAGISLRILIFFF